MYKEDEDPIYNGMSLNFENKFEELLNMQKVISWSKTKNENSVVSYKFNDNYCELTYSNKDMYPTFKKHGINYYYINLPYTISHANAFLIISLFFTLESLYEQDFKTALLDIYSNFVVIEPLDEDVSNF